MSETSIFRIDDWLSFADIPKRTVEIESTSRNEAIVKYIKKYYPDKKESEFGGIKMGIIAKYVSGKIDKTKTTRCVVCGSEFTDIEIEGATSCPECGSDKTPVSTKDDVTIKINWHELRILCIWAENWAKQIDEENKKDNLLTIMSIVQRIQKQHPKKTPLTLFSEIRDLRKDYEIDSDLDDDSLIL